VAGILSRPHRFWPLCLPLAVILVQCYYGSIRLADHPEADAKFYLAMSADGPSASPAPYGYRVLGPWLAGALPCDVHLAYRLLTVSAAAACALALYFLFLAFGIPAFAAGMAVLLWLPNKYLVGMELWDFYQLGDWLGLLGLLAAMLAFERKRWVLLAGAFLAGLLARETPILLLPGFALAAWLRRFGRREWIALGAALLPGLVAAAWLRIHYRLPAEAGYLGLLRIYGVKWFSPLTPVRFFLNAWIPVALLPWICFPATRDFLRRRPDLLVLGAGTVFAASLGSDNERLLMPAVPLVYGVVAHLLAQRPRLAPGLLICAVVSLPHHLVGPWTLSSRNGTLFFSLLGTVLAGGWALWVRRAVPGSTSQGGKREDHTGGAALRSERKPLA
jgi:hypothetical protein